MMPMTIQPGDPSGLKAPRMNKNAKIIKIPAVINAMIRPVRIVPPLT
jgi:hypothetical protein